MSQKQAILNLILHNHKIRAKKQRKYYRQNM
nr:MAG TPA: hypothetical protein [Caudoviricetes sp.]